MHRIGCPIMSISDLLPTVEIETSSTPDYAVIWMHGLGADGYDFQPIVPELYLPSSMAVVNYSEMSLVKS